MRRTFAFFIIVFFVAFPASAQPREEKARTVELTLHPAKAPEPVQKYQLLPKAQEQTDADAVPLYEKAVQSLPKDLKTDQISQWLDTPSDKLPLQQVQSILQQFKPALQLVEQAIKYRQCNWPAAESGVMPVNLPEYRRLARTLALQARFQIAQGQYDQAISTIQTGFAMAKHIGGGPTVVQGLVGIAIGALMCRQIEEFIQVSGAPNLFWSLRALPKPFIDLTKQMDLEMPDVDVKNRIRLLMNRLDRHVAALQCIEALCLYAAGHNGKFPNALAEITEVSIPGDPATLKSFSYTRTGSRAVLEAAAPEGATEKEAMRYELKLMEQSSKP